MWYVLGYFAPASECTRKHISRRQDQNLDRVLPSGCDAIVHRGSWNVPRIIETVVQAASLSEDEAYKTFNMGVGFMLVLDSAQAPDAAASLRAAGETVVEVGEIVSGSGKVAYR
jgi:phosphoribosylformylglycinamidine cyclo-ligase